MAARWAIAIHGGAGVDPNLPEHRGEARAGAVPAGGRGRGRGARARDGALLQLGPRLRAHPPRHRRDGGQHHGRPRRRLHRQEPRLPRAPRHGGFDGAEEFARAQGLETVDNSYFITEDNIGMLKLAKEANTILFDYRIPVDTCSALAGAEQTQQNGGGMVMNGLPISIYAPETVGCAVVDSSGFCAAATSTGGLMNKMTGRIGDSPLIGSGTYACDACAVSCTGEGEAIIRSTLARDVAAVMEYKGLPLQAAVDYCVKERLDEGFAGLIAVSNTGEVAYGFNCTGMFRGCATEDGFMEVGIWE